VRKKTQILCEKEFKKLGCDTEVSTDDGSRGFKGKVTDLLKDFLLKNLRTKEPKNIIYGCGPRPMLREISRISAEYDIPAQISLEEHMACGIGACLGCVVKIRRQKSEDRNQKKQNSGDFEYVRVCKEGPVFQAQDIIWEVKP
ncbi:MAG: hypothetical protein PHG40_04455, partial [Candidatus Omnitrophica bacterium]|nr:hypothetical protein [Candidatus Omnitrophota bacterium]